MEILTVGNYCHDTLLRADGAVDVLGGSTAYVSQALRAAKMNFHSVSKVGKDFRYFDQICTSPQVSENALTAHFLDSHERCQTTSVLKQKGEPIYPKDLPNGRAKIGIVCGVENEVLPETFRALRDQVDILICDIQGLIRRVEPDGKISLQPLRATPFHPMLSMIDFLKMNAKEMLELDFADVTRTQLLITRGPEGIRWLDGKSEKILPSPKVTEVDPTGAGDSFVAGLSIGLCKGYPTEKAILLAAQYGALAVQTVGIPDYSAMKHLLSF